MMRGRRGREWAKLEFAAAIVGIAFAAITWIAQPGWFGPMFRNGTAEVVMVVVGFVGVAVGLLWMLRIYDPDPEPDQRAWRYRDRD
jgi:hypothetical protein